MTPGVARVRLAVAAVMVSALTCAIVVAVDGEGVHRAGVVLYLGVTVAAAFSPPAITAQVIGGQLLVASALFGTESVSSPAAAGSTIGKMLLLAPALAGVVATAELLAVVARMEGPLTRHAHGVMRRVGWGAAVGGGVYALVSLASVVPGPTGLLAVTVAAVASFLLANRMAKGAERAGAER